MNTIRKWSLFPTLFLGPHLHTYTFLILPRLACISATAPHFRFLLCSVRKLSKRFSVRLFCCVSFVRSLVRSVAVAFYFMIIKFILVRLFVLQHSNNNSDNNNKNNNDKIMRKWSKSMAEAKKKTRRRGLIIQHPCTISVHLI